MCWPRGCNPPRLPATPLVAFSGRRVDEPTEKSDWGAMWCDVTWRGHWFQQQTERLHLSVCHSLPAVDFPVNVAVPPDVTVLSSDQAVGRLPSVTVAIPVCGCLAGCMASETEASEKLMVRRFSGVALIRTTTRMSWRVRLLAVNQRQPRCGNETRTLQTNSCCVSLIDQHAQFTHSIRLLVITTRSATKLWCQTVSWRCIAHKKYTVLKFGRLVHDASVQPTSWLKPRTTGGTRSLKWQCKLIATFVVI